MYIIPAIDLIDGKCVRLTKGDYSSKKEYNSDPLEVAKIFEDAGLTKLHLVDLDGAKERTVVNLNILEMIATRTKLEIDFGGGVQSDRDIERVFNAGANQITAGSVAVLNPEIFENWMETWGPEKIILGADVKSDKIAIGAWENESSYTWRDFIKEKLKVGIKYMVSTDIEKDGMLEGPSFTLYKQMREAFPALNIIASGGISVLQDLIKLEENGLYGAIVGKAYYENRISVEDLGLMNNRNVS